MKAKPTYGPAIPNPTGEDLRRQIAKGREADEIFRLVVEATPNAIVPAAAQVGTRLVNAVAKSFFGLRPPVGRPPPPRRQTHSGTRLATG